MKTLSLIFCLLASAQAAALAQGGAPALRSAVISAPFTPRSIPGLQVWYVADSLGLNDGASISTWRDSSGKGNHATQVTGGSQPVFKTAIQNGKPVVRFNGTSSYFDHLYSLGSGAAGAVAQTTFAVAKTTPAATFKRLYSAAAPGEYLNSVILDGTTSGSQWSTYYNSTANQAAGTLANWTVACSSFSGTLSVAGNLVLSHNGAPDASVTVTSIFADGLERRSIGGYSGGEYITGDIAEIIVYSAFLSSIDRKKVERYLGRKYAIAVQ